jgi:hypothetical protein
LGGEEMELSTLPMEGDILRNKVRRFLKTMKKEKVMPRFKSRFDEKIIQMKKMLHIKSINLLKSNEK